MKDYTYQDMLKMQEDAAVRVREMRKRATLATEEINDGNNSENAKKKGIVEQLAEDPDAILVTSIIMLLLSENNDYLTGFALLYILL